MFPYIHYVNVSLKFLILVHLSVHCSNSQLFLLKNILSKQNPVPNKTTID